MPKATKKKPPSRIKYEQSHPTVTCRVSREIYDRLVEAREVYGKSFADILKIGLGIHEAQAEDSEKVFMKGYEEGYNDAKSYFLVTYRCSKCGRIIEVEDEDERKTIGKYLTEKGWTHEECPQS